MQATKLWLVSPLAFALSLATGVCSADSAELWEIFAPAGAIHTLQDDNASGFKATIVDPAVVTESAGSSRSCRPTFACPVATEPAAAWFALEAEEPSTQAVLACDIEEASALGAPNDQTRHAAMDDEVRELWAMFSSTEDTTGKVAGALPGPHLERKRRLHVAQAIEEIPHSLPEVLTFPSAAEPSATTGETSALERSILKLTLDASVRSGLQEGIAGLDGDLAIQDLAVEKYGSWEAPQREASVPTARFPAGQLSWAAPASYSRPLYFEQPNLERYGHHVALCKHDNLTQSAISAAHFFVTVPALPYALGANSPDECSYVLGSYRPGSCNPHQLVKPRLSLKGLALEGAVATGLVFLVP